MKNKKSWKNYLEKNYLEKNKTSPLLKTPKKDFQSLTVILMFWCLKLFILYKLMFMLNKSI